MSEVAVDIERPRPRRRRWLRWLGTLALLGLLVLTVLLGEAWTALGREPSGPYREELKVSKNYRDERFVNPLEVRTDGWGATKKWLSAADDHRTPDAPIPVVKRDRASLADLPASGLRVTWFGHSTMLVEIDGKRLLIDPVWGRRASPSRWLGPERFHEPPAALADLPAIDAVVLSHDHYDHLDLPTVRELDARGVTFIVPLGVGSHLGYWGVPADRIVELDWWERTRLGEIELVCAPARHFSGRAVWDRDATLWAGWAFLGPRHRVFYSGDTGMFPGFAEIGERLGPFDVTMIESGAYNALWPDVHLGPEQAVRAHELVRGRLMIPVHWGTFDLAVHSWTEPAERLLAAAASRSVDVFIPRPGESVDPGARAPQSRWWPGIPWQTAAEAPVVSTQLPPELVPPGAVSPR